MEDTGVWTPPRYPTLELYLEARSAGRLFVTKGKGFPDGMIAMIRPKQMGRPDCGPQSPSSFMGAGSISGAVDPQRSKLALNSDGSCLTELSPKEAHLTTLLRRCASGDSEAGNELLCAMARELSGLSKRLAVDLIEDEQDLLQLGLIAVWESVAAYDPARGTSPSTWACMVAESAMRESGQVQRYFRRVLHRWSWAEAELCQRFGRQPTIFEISDSTGISQRTIQNARLRQAAVRPIQALDTDGEFMHFVDDSSMVPMMLSVEEALVTLPASANRDELELLLEAIDQLSDRNRCVVVLTFFHDSTHQEIGRKLGISPENSRKILERALEKLKEMLEDKL